MALIVNKMLIVIITFSYYLLNVLLCPQKERGWREALASLSRRGAAVNRYAGRVGPVRSGSQFFLIIEDRADSQNFIFHFT